MGDEPRCRNRLTLSGQPFDRYGAAVFGVYVAFYSSPPLMELLIKLNFFGKISEKRRKKEEKTLGAVDGLCFGCVTFIFLGITHTRV